MSPANRSRRSAAERPHTPAATAAQAGWPAPSCYQFLTIAGALTVVNSVLIGNTPALAVQTGTELETVPARLAERLEPM
jgi:hypothetical protein